MAETPKSKVLTRRMRQELMDKLESAPTKFSERILPHGSDCPKTSREQEYTATPVPPFKLSPRGTAQQSTCASKTTVCTKKTSASSAARRKQLELQAAEAKAKIQMELIDKKLEADLAKVDADDDHLADTDVTPDEENGTNCSRSLPEVPEQQTHKNVEKWLERNCSPVQPQKDSIQELAHTLKDLMKQTTTQHEDRLLSRLATPRELPLFSGDCIEWLHFKSAYDDSSRVCRFSDSENLWRLRRALRGEAKEAVTDLLIGNTPPSAVIEALELRFGRADIIIQNITMQLKKLPSLSNYYQQDLTYFAVKVNNCVATIRALEQHDYLRSPELAAAIVSKMPSTLIGKWTEFAYNRLRDGRSKLELLATFLKTEAEMLSVVGCTQPREYKKPIDTGVKRPDDKFRHRSVYTSAVTDDDKKCLFCQKDNHNLPDCRIFKRAMRRDRWNFVKKQRLCYCCLSTKQHNSNLCPAPVCDVDSCGMAHHRLLHWTKPTTTSQSADMIRHDGPKRVLLTPDADASITHVARDDDVMDPSTSSKTEEFALLKVIAVKLRGPNGIIHTYALLDEGAAVSMIDSDLAETLGLKCENPCAIKFTDAFGLEVYQSKVPKVKLEISGQDNAFYDINLRKCDKLKLSAQNMSLLNKVNSSHLDHIKPFICAHSVVPRILLGEDNYFLIAPLEIVHGDRNSLYASRCRLGWTIHGYHKGRTHSSVSELNVFHLARSADNNDDLHEISELNSLIKNSFELDSVGISNLCRENKDHVRAVDILDKTSRQVGPQWEVGLPFRKDDFKMPDSYFNAYSRQQVLLRKFQKDNGYAVRYKQEMDKLFKNGCARELKDDERSADHVWYLPHFGVLNPNKPDKLRLVWDAASKVDDVNLNNYLLTGPDLYNSLFGIMLRFRENPIVIIGDIRDMFLRIKIRSEDQHVLRFLWQESTDSPVKICVMQSLIFGATCSPFIAQYIKNKNALKYADVNSEAVDVIINNHYMDDCLYSTCDESTAIRLVHEITSIHSNGGFEIRGWLSNNKQVLDSIPTDALAHTAIQFKDGVNNTSERTLGLIWHPADDSFGFKINLTRIPKDILDGTVPPTKAKMLSIIMSIYDIHGFLSPFLIKSKIILQDVHRSNVDWKCQIQPAEHIKWVKWLEELKHLELLRIPRWYLNAGSWTHCNPAAVGKLDANTIVNKQMHIFCDASIKSYAAIIFWRLTRCDGNVLVCFVAAKSRVTPLRPVSVPRLELQGALIAARLTDAVQREHKDLKPDKRYFWTDSHTVLQWIRSDPRNYKPFVAHRLGEIDELTVTSEWRYVPSKLNVADVSTKEDSPPLAYDSIWFQGPGFLRQHEETWPKDLKSTKTSHDAVCESRSVNVMTSHVIEHSLPNENDFSSWIKLVRVTARVLLFLKRCRRIDTQLSVELMNDAEKLLLKKCQQDSFARDIEQLKENKPLLSTSRLLTLTPYIDREGILRVQGRIDKVQGVEQSVTRPAILDGHHQMTRLLVEYYHRKALHGAHELVVNELRQRYWVIKLRPTVRGVAARCLFCRYRRAAPQPQRMADLPAARLQHNRRPFTFTGIDFFGPMEVTIGRRRQKRSIAITLAIAIAIIGPQASGFTINRNNSISSFKAEEQTDLLSDESMLLVKDDLKRLNDINASRDEDSNKTTNNDKNYVVVTKMSEVKTEATSIAAPTTMKSSSTTEDVKIPTISSDTVEVFDSVEDVTEFKKTDKTSKKYLAIESDLVLDTTTTNTLTRIDKATEAHYSTEVSSITNQVPTESDLSIISPPKNQSSNSNADHKMTTKLSFTPEITTDSVDTSTLTTVPLVEVTSAASSTDLTLSISETSFSNNSSSNESNTKESSTLLESDITESTTDTPNTKVTQPTRKNYTTIIRKRVSSSENMSQTDRTEDETMKAETSNSYVNSRSVTAMPLGKITVELQMYTNQPSSRSEMVSEESVKTDVTIEPTIPSLNTIESVEPSTAHITRAGYLDHSKKTITPFDASFTSIDKDIGTETYGIIDDIAITETEGPEIKVSGSESQSQLAEDAIQEELMKEEALNNNQDNVNRYPDEKAESEGVKPLADDAVGTEPVDSLSVRPIHERTKTTLYTVSVNYKPMKKIDVQPIKAFVRDPDDNSWRNESISSLGIVFKPKNSSKSFKEALKNKSQTELKNLQEKDSSKEVMPDLRVRLEKIAEVRKTKKKKLNKDGEEIYAEYEDSGSAERSTSKQKPETVHSIFGSAELTKATTLSDSPKNIGITNPMSIRKEMEDKMKATSGQAPFDSLGVNPLTTHKPKKLFNIAEYYDTTDEYDADYVTMTKLDLKKFTVPRTTRPPVTFPTAPQPLPARRPTVQYFPPRSAHNVVLNNLDVDFERNMKGLAFIKDSPKTEPRPFVTASPARIATEHPGRATPHSGVTTLRPEAAPAPPFSYTLYIPTDLDENFYSTNSPRPAEPRPAGDGAPDGGSYVIKHYKDFLDAAAKDEEDDRNWNLIPPTDSPMRASLADRPAPRREYGDDGRFPKEVLSRFVDNFNRHSERFKMEFPILYNSTVVHRAGGASVRRQHGAGEGAGGAASSRASVRRQHGAGEGAGGATPAPARPPCDACDVTVELAPAYELHYYVPGQEEREQAEPRAASSAAPAPAPYRYTI